MLISGYYVIPIQSVLVVDQMSNDVTYKPGTMFDSDTATFYQNGWGTGNPPWIKIYFGDEMTVSEVTIVNRLDQTLYLGNLENTTVSVLMSDDSEVECGTLTGVNTGSLAVEDQVSLN